MYIVYIRMSLGGRLDDDAT